MQEEKQIQSEKKLIKHYSRWSQADIIIQEDFSGQLSDPIIHDFSKDIWEIAKTFIQEPLTSIERKNIKTISSLATNNEVDKIIYILTYPNKRKVVVVRGKVIKGRYDVMIWGSDLRSWETRIYDYDTEKSEMKIIWPDKKEQIFSDETEGINPLLTQLQEDAKENISDMKNFK